MSANQGLLMTAEQVAERLGVSVAWVYKHATGGKRPKLPCIKLGGALRFRPESIERFIAQLEDAA